MRVSRAFFLVAVMTLVSSSIAWKIAARRCVSVIAAPFRGKLIQIEWETKRSFGPLVPARGCRQPEPIRQISTHLSRPSHRYSAADALFVRLRRLGRSPERAPAERPVQVALDRAIGRRDG